MTQQDVPFAHLSVSSLKTFLSCPRRFRLRYIDKERGTHRSAALALGSAWHATIGRLLFEHAQGSASSPDELKEHLRAELGKELRADGPPVLFEDGETEGDLVDTCERMLEVFIKRVQLPSNSCANLAYQGIRGQPARHCRLTVGSSRMRIVHPG